MKRLNLTTAKLVIVITLLLTTSVGYADLSGSGWWSAQQIQAVGEGDTTVAFAAYTQDPSASPSQYFCGSVVLGEGDVFVFVPTDQFGPDFVPNCAVLPDDFQGSAVASADGAVVGIVEETNQYAGVLGAQNGTADASYQAIGGAEAATVLRFPTFKSDHASETTTFYIQNAGDAATRLRATFQECNVATTPECNGTGASYVYTLTTPLEPYRMAIIVPGDAAGMPAGYGHFGGLTVESLDGQPLAGVVNEHRTTTDGPARYLKSTRAFTPADADRTLYAPALKKTFPLPMSGGTVTLPNELTKWSALVIQNAGTTVGNFTITYRVANSQLNPSRENQEIVDDTTCRGIVPGETCFAMTLYPIRGSGTELLEDGEYVAATVTGDVDMVAVVNEETLYDHTPIEEKQFATYSTVPDKDKSRRVGAPSYKEEWVSRYMGVVVQNVGTSAAVVTATVKAVNASGTLPAEQLVARKADLAPNSAVTFFLLSQEQAQQFQDVEIVSGIIGEYEGTNGGMIIDANQPVAVLINQENSYLNPPATRLDAANYEGFPLGTIQAGR